MFRLSKSPGLIESRSYLSWEIVMGLVFGLKQSSYATQRSAVCGVASESQWRDCPAPNAEKVGGALAERSANRKFSHFWVKYSVHLLRLSSMSPAKQGELIAHTDLSAFRATI